MLSPKFTGWVSEALISPLFLRPSQQSCPQGDLSNETALSEDKVEGSNTSTDCQERRRGKKNPYAAGGGSTNTSCRPEPLKELNCQTFQTASHRTKVKDLLRFALRNVCHSCCVFSFSGYYFTKNNNETKQKNNCLGLCRFSKFMVQQK